VGRVEGSWAPGSVPIKDSHIGCASPLAGYTSGVQATHPPTRETHALRLRHPSDHRLPPTLVRQEPVRCPGSRTRHRTSPQRSVPITHPPTYERENPMITSTSDREALFSAYKAIARVCRPERSYRRVMVQLGSSARLGACQAWNRADNALHCLDAGFKAGRLA
jgi:hypothetical protein